jgi:hypothetical protein
MIDLALDNEMKLKSRSNLHACKSEIKSNFSIKSRSTICMQGGKPKKFENL